MKRVFLIGYMGVGKTTIGKNLARRLNLSFIDLDHYIETRFHKTISSIFTEKGEDGFRQIESNLLHEVGMFENVLISTGGGAPCFFDNMEFMNRVGRTVYLKASTEELADRLSKAKHVRPVIEGRSGAELIDFIAESLKKRTPFYMQAHIAFDTDNMSGYRDMQNGLSALRELILNIKEEE